MRSVWLVLRLGLRHGRSLSLFLELNGHLGFDLCPRAPRHAGLGVLRSMLRHLILRRSVRHHHIRLRGHGLLRMMSMLCVRGGVWVVRHGLVVRRMLVIH